MEELLGALKIDNLNELIGFIYNKNTSKKEISSLAPVVSECASRGDELSRDIIIDAGKALVALVESVRNRGFEGRETVDITLHGSVLRKIEILRSYVIDNLKGIRVIQSDNEPAYGAVLIGLQHLK
jgi:N-acetylglucosamine kinase-like BadF-type ATPase